MSSTMGNIARAGAYLALNTQLNGNSLNDKLGRYTGHQVEVNDANGNRIGDPRTDNRKADQAYEAGQYETARNYRSDARSYQRGRNASFSQGMTQPESRPGTVGSTPNQNWMY